MMKNKISVEKGITLVSLVITITVLVILTNIIIYNSASSLKIERVDAMKNDIANLRDMISTYYAKNGKIPAKLQYTNIDHIRQAGLISEAADTGNFYVIDLSALENLTLNYGKDYEQVKNLTEGEDVNNYTDLYIINETSHNIFYVKGVEFDKSTFYTDYSSEDIDKEPVELKYVENIKIPEGFYYVGGTKDTGIVISDVEDDDLDNSKQGNQFVWIPVEDESEYVRNTNYADSTVSTSAYDDTDYLPDGIDNEKKAVLEAGGFYISRFEAGKETIDGEDTLVSKKGATVWNNIKQEDCKTTAKKFKDDSNVKSALISGIQWDMVMEFVDGNKDGTNHEFDVKTKDNNRHKGSEEKSGQNEADEVCNIYDLEGNYCEYLAEKSGDDTGLQIVQRSGYYNGSQSGSASYRYGKQDGADQGVSFRLVLYVINNNWSPTYDKIGIYKDKNGDIAHVPGGFQVSQMPGQNTVDDGLVVRDENQNEFVWIPCGINDDATSETTADGKINYNAKRSNDWQTYQEYYNGGTWGDGQPNDPEIQQSIKNNGGFYVARYEAGIPENSAAYANSDKAQYKTDTEKNNNTDIPVSKRGVQAWSYIDQTHAKDRAEKMIVNDGVQSKLIDSHAWDTVCRVINKTEGKNLTDSTEWGNYYNNGTTKYEDLNTLYAVHNGGTCATEYKKGPVPAGPKGSGENRLELSTGASEDFKAYNIYDLAGNMWEWTTENGTNPENNDANAEMKDIGKTDAEGTDAVFRGGSFGFTNSGDWSQVIHSDGNFAANYKCFDVGFRVVLYLK